MKKKQNADDDDSDEIPTDELINEWLARGEEEFEIFQEMDRIRYEKEKQIYTNFQEYNEN